MKNLYQKVLDVMLERQKADKRFCICMSISNLYWNGVITAEEYSNLLADLRGRKPGINSKFWWTWSYNKLDTGFWWPCTKTGDAQRIKFIKHVIQQFN